VATPRKHWFRVQDSILHETWPIEIKGVMVNLCAYLNTRWAREGLTAEDACVARLSPAACCLVTGSQRLVKARAMLHSLAVETKLTVTEDGADTLIRWDKFAEVQGLLTLKLPESLPRVAPSASAPADAPATATKKKTNTSCSTAGAVQLAPADDPARWVNILGAEPGSDEEKLAFVTRELPLAQAEAEQHCPRDRKAQRGKIRSVLIRHYRWQRSNPAPARASPRGPQRPVTFAEQSAQNPDDAFRGAFDVLTRSRGEHDGESLEPGADRGAIDVPATVLLRDRH
jgi:hypothetical protein